MSKVTVVFHYPCSDEPTKTTSQTYIIDGVCFQKMLDELKACKIKHTNVVEEDGTSQIYLSKPPLYKKMTYILMDVAKNAVAILEMEETQNEIQEYYGSQDIEEQSDPESDFLGIPLDEQYPRDCSDY